MLSHYIVNEKVLSLLASLLGVHPAAPPRRMILPVRSRVTALRSPHTISKYTQTPTPHLDRPEVEKKEVTPSSHISWGNEEVRGPE